MKILALGAHSDDTTLGCGGTLKNHSRKGNTVWELVFTLGNRFPPWISKEKLEEKRKKESLEAAKILGIKKTIFLRFHEFKLVKEKSEAIKKLVKILNKFKPDIIYTHHAKDLHPDHANVFRILQQTLKEVKIKPAIYGYEVNSYSGSLQKTNTVLVVNDITKSYETKMKAVNVYESQKILTKPINFLLNLKSLYYGKKIGKDYTETFFKYDL